MSDFLFSTPSFLEGFARNIDIFGALDKYNTSRTSSEADEMAYMADVAVLKSDMSIAVKKVLEK